MVDDHLSTLISRFQGKAKELNAASDSINTVITDVERKLVDANAGLEVWVQDGRGDALEITESSRRLTAEENGQSRAYWDWYEMYLGFAKINQTEGWRLAVRVRRHIVFERAEDHELDSSKESAEIVKTEALWKAGRNVRLKALEVLPSLVGRLTDAADKAVRTIETAKLMVK
jgi:hypothetical protein